MAEAIVEFDYKSEQPDELTIKKGDIITDISFISDGWWEGTLTRLNKRGMFPDNFVKLISDPDGKASVHQSSTGRKCQVLFNYKPAKEDELELQVGDVIDILSEVEEGWWRGKLKNRVGVFPSNFVAEIVEKNTREAIQRKHKTSQDETFKSSTVHTQESASSTNAHSVTSTSKIASTSVQLSPELPVLPPKPVKELCKAIFNYEAQNSDELTLQEGDVITLITKEGQDPGWWKGELKGKIGFFPDNFVHVITPSEDVAKPDRPSKVVSTSAKPISKLASASSMSSITSISRKFSDTSKSDEKFNHPSISKKPVLPPPSLKKPHRSSSDLAKSPTAPNLLSSKVVDISPTSQVATSRTGSMSLTTKQTNSETSNSSSSSKWSSITETTNDNTDGALWSKQGSYTIKTENNVVSVNSGSNEPDLDIVSRAAMLTHPTATRVKAPKRRPPSAIIKDEMKNGEEEEEEVAVLSTTNSTTVTSTTITHTSTVITSLSSSSSSSSSSNIRTSTMLVNGDSDSHTEKPAKAPWVKELEFNQAKKSLQSGKTRVMIGGDSAVPTSSSTVSPGVNNSPTAVSPESKPLGVTLRSNQGTGSNVPRPQSLIGSLRSSLSGNSNAGDSNTTITIKQFNELQEKITKMELHFESHISALTRTVKELSSKLDEERLRRAIMQQELEKLTDLVTQV